MADHPHEEAIKLLYAAEKAHPAAAVVLDEKGPRLSVNTGHTDSAVEAQLTMIAGYVGWLAEHTDVPPQQVTTDVLEIVHQLRDDEQTQTFEWNPEELTDDE